MIEKIASNWKIRNTIYILISVIAILPFIYFGQFKMDVDAWFHFSRIYEIADNIKNGKFIPDISYYTFNKQAYGVNFFYPYIINYFQSIILLVIKDPITTILLSNIIFHLIGLNIAFDTYNQLKLNKKVAFIFSLMFVFIYGSVNNRMLNMGTYNQQIAYMFMPYVIVGIYQLFFGDYKKWQTRLIFGIVMITFTHVLSLAMAIGYAMLLFISLIFFRKDKITMNRLKSAIYSGISIVLATAIFTIPMLEQKTSNDWLAVPTLNIIHKDVVSKSATITALTKIEGALNFSDLISLLLLIAICYIFYIRALDKQLKIILLCIGITLFITSPIIPYGVLENISLISMIQSINRVEVFYIFGASLFTCITLQKYYHSGHRENIITPFIFLALLLALYNVVWGARDGVIVSKLDDFQKNSYIATKETIEKGLKKPNFGYFAPDDYKAYYRVNGFYDYRTKNQILNEEGNIGVVNYSIKNNDSKNPYVNFPKDYMRKTNDFIENAVYFDGQRKLKKFKQDKFEFSIKDIPKGTKVVRTPITYLKGFKVEDTNGNRLDSYKDSNGWLAINNPNSSKVVITYHKTMVHKLSIGVSLTTWYILLYISLFTKKTKDLYL